MAVPQNPNARIDPLVYDRLKALQSGIEDLTGGKPSHDVIVSALIYGATVPQLHGVLLAYREHARSMRTPDSANGGGTTEAEEDRAP